MGRVRLSVAASLGAVLALVIGTALDACAEFGGGDDAPGDDAALETTTDGNASPDGLLGDANDAADAPADAAADAGPFCDGSELLCDQFDNGGSFTSQWQGVTSGADASIQVVMLLGAPSGPNAVRATLPQSSTGPASAVARSVPALSYGSGKGLLIEVAVRVQSGSNCDLVQLLGQGSVLALTVSDVGALEGRLVGGAPVLIVPSLDSGWHRLSILLPYAPPGNAVAATITVDGKTNVTIAGAQALGANSGGLALWIGAPAPISGSGVRLVAVDVALDDVRVRATP